MNIHEIEAKTVLHYHEQEFATKWDLNVYRGCGHRCTYCFAQYTQKYTENAEFYDDIFVKVNVAQVLDKEMSAHKWKHEPVTVSGVSDCYQPIEANYELMPQVLSTFIKHRNPIVIITKSNMILRDIELLKQLTEVADVNVCISLMSLNEDIIRLLEPGAPTARDRLKVLEELKKNTKVKITLIAAPIIPFFTDDIVNMSDLMRAAAYYDVDRVQHWAVHFRGCDRRKFLQVLGDRVNWQEFCSIYNGSFVNKDYNNWLRARVVRLKQQYAIRDHHIELKYREPKQPEQMSLFDLVK